MIALIDSIQWRGSDPNHASMLKACECDELDESGWHGSGDPRQLNESDPHKNVVMDFKSMTIRRWRNNSTIKQ